MNNLYFCNIALLLILLSMFTGCASYQEVEIAQKKDDPEKKTIPVKFKKNAGPP